MTQSQNGRRFGRAMRTPIGGSRSPGCEAATRCQRLSHRCQTSCCQVGCLGWRRPTTVMMRNYWLISESIPRMAPPWTSTSTRQRRRRLPTPHGYPDVVRSLTFPAMTPREASLTAQMPFQHCLQCSREGLSLRHWRRAWAFDCQVCGTRLVQTLGKSVSEQISGKLIYRARRGAAMLDCAARSRSPKQLRRAMRAVTFAMSLKGLPRGTVVRSSEPQTGSEAVLPCCH